MNLILKTNSIDPQSLNLVCEVGWTDGVAHRAAASGARSPLDTAEVEAWVEAGALEQQHGVAE